MNSKPYDRSKMNNPNAQLLSDDWFDLCFR